MAEIILTRGERAIVDDEDFDYLNDITWYRCGRYAVTAVRIGKITKFFYMHKMIMRAEKGVYVDHINGDAFDNRKCNLRIVTNQQNAMNSKVNVNSKTGLKGVHWCNRDKRYVAKIKANDKQMTLGYFRTPEEAAIAYNRAALKYFGEYARLNKPVNGYFQIKV